MDKSTTEFWMAQGPWAFLFVITLVAIGIVAKKMLDKSYERDKEYRDESAAREEKLKAHNEGYQKALGELAAGQQQLTAAVTEMRHDINKIEDRLNERAQRVIRWA